MINTLLIMIKWHHLDNNATFKKLKYVYSRCTFDCNQLDLYKKNFLPFINYQYYQIICKKRNISLDNIVTMKRYEIYKLNIIGDE